MPCEPPPRPDWPKDCTCNRRQKPRGRPRSVAHAARRRTAKGHRRRQSTRPISTFRDSSTPSRSRPRSRTAASPRSTFRRRKKCPAFVRFCTAGTSGQSIAQCWSRIFWRTDERRPPFEDDVVRYYGQYVAAGGRRDVRNGQSGRRRSSRRHTPRRQPNVAPELETEDEPDVVDTTFAPYKRLQEERGDPDGAFAEAPVKLDQTYVTPTETHNPMELHATTAMWDGSTLDGVRLNARSRELPQRAVANVRLARGERPRHHAGFWARASAASYGLGRTRPLAVAAARQLGRPVKLVVSRKMMFQTVGHRPRTQQRVRLGATPDGKLVVAAARVRVSTRRCSTFITRIAASPRESSTASRTFA